MSLLKAEPAEIRSMDQLLAIASAMEQEAIAGYAKLAERMRQEGREELAEVFDRLVAEETEHFNNVVHWTMFSAAARSRSPLGSRLRHSKTRAPGSLPPNCGQKRGGNVPAASN